MKIYRNILLLMLVLLTNLYPQIDTTISQAFKEAQPRRRNYFKAKYPSYSLLAGYLLVTEANRGDPFAEHELGLRYLVGQGFAADTVKAVYWIRKAVDKNLPAARFNYGILLYNGIGVPWNPFEAFNNFKIASNSGLPEAQFAYGILMTDNLTVNRDYGGAYKLFKSAAKAGYQPAKEVIEQMKKSGFIPPSDSSVTNDVKADETAQLINQQWDLDFYDFENTTKAKDSVVSINKILSKSSSELKKYFGIDEGTENTKLPDTTGIGILKFAAANGSPEAILLIGKSYETGENFQKSLIAAASNYLRAYRLGSYKAGNSLLRLVQQNEFINELKIRANKKDPEAMYVFAGMTALGFANILTNEQALDLLKDAVVKNHIPSMIELGICYSAGTLVNKNLNEAFKYWQQAKDLGSREAEIRIAFAILADSTNSADKSEQIKILQKSSDEGSVLAQTLLGFCYEKGLGIKENKKTAVMYYRIASQRGNETAFNSLKRMYDDIRPAEDEFKIYETEQ
jgi:uncharacterized protein